MTEADLKQIQDLLRLELKPLYEAQSEIERKVDSLITIEPSSNQLAFWVKGAFKSWTVWVNAIIFALPDLLPLIIPDLLVLKDPTVDWAIKITSVANLLIRLKTSQSLVEKGKGVEK